MTLPKIYDRLEMGKYSKREEYSHANLVLNEKQSEKCSEVPLCGEVGYHLLIIS